MVYMDIRISGTPTSNAPILYFDGTTNITGATGQTWTMFAFLQRTAGSLSNINSINLHLAERTAAGALVTTHESAITAAASGNLTAAQQTRTFTTNGGGTTARLQPGLRLDVALNPVDITLRIGAIQLEQGSFATSFIPTTSAAVIRAAESMNISTGTWYTQATGTMYSDAGWGSSSGSNFPMLVRIWDGTSNNRWNIFYNQSTNIIGAGAHVSGVSQGSFATGTQSTEGSIRAALAQASNNANASFNGSIGTLDTSWTTPTVTQWNREPAQARIWTRVFKYYPVRVSDAQLQLLTQ
jgi:hypothetical protein